MKKVLLGLLMALALPTAAMAGCSSIEVCGDVLDTLVIRIGGSSESTVSWESGSEPVDLDDYRVVRSLDPAAGNWVQVATVPPEYTCGNQPAAYEVTEQTPAGSWSYGVQVFSNGSLVCTIIAE